MTIRVIIASLTILVLGGCTQNLHEILNPEPPVEVVEIEEPDANRSLDYYSYISDLQGEALLREYQRAQRLFVDEPTDHHRMQLVMLLASQDAPFRNTSSAKVLLQARHKNSKPKRNGPPNCKRSMTRRKRHSRKHGRTCLIRVRTKRIRTRVSGQDTPDHRRQCDTSRQTREAQPHRVLQIATAAPPRSETVQGALAVCRTQDDSAATVGERPIFHRFFLTYSRYARQNR